MFVLKASDACSNFDIKWNLHSGGPHPQEQDKGRMSRGAPSMEVTDTKVTQAFLSRDQSLCLLSGGVRT